jgi:hypothetical protein
MRQTPRHRALGSGGQIDRGNRFMKPEHKVQRRAALANVKKTWWPDVTTEIGFKSALAQGWGIALFAALSNAVLFIVAIAFGWLPGAEGLDGTARMVILGFLLLGAVGGLILTWLLKTRASKIAAVILLVWIVLEMAMRLLQAPPGAWVFGIMFILCAVNGVRAAFAKFRPSSTADVTTFS